jgi:hypothetical protein
MGIVDVLVAIIVVTILVTIVLGVVTYLAYKLRLARKPMGGASASQDPRYFRLHLAPIDGPSEVGAPVVSPNGSA